MGLPRRSVPRVCLALPYLRCGEARARHKHMGLWDCSEAPACVDLPHLLAFPGVTDSPCHPRINPASSPTCPRAYFIPPYLPLHPDGSKIMAKADGRRTTAWSPQEAAECGAAPKRATAALSPISAMAAAAAASATTDPLADWSHMEDKGYRAGPPLASGLVVVAWHRNQPSSVRLCDRSSRRTAVVDGVHSGAHRQQLDAQLYRSAVSPVVDAFLRGRDAWAAFVGPPVGDPLGALLTGALGVGAQSPRVGRQHDRARRLFSSFGGEQRGPSPPLLLLATAAPALLST